MSSGLLALLDDVVALAKVAAVTLDDAASQVAKAGSKAAGIVIDDAAVTPRYVVGFASDRELPIVAKIAWGSLKNKMLFLLPAAIALSALAPWLITPLLMIGGLFLCFEGYEKAHEWIAPHDDHGTGTEASVSGADAKALEDEKVAGAIRTDLILSAEIMAIALASITSPSLISKAITLALVGMAITVLVYGAVALIVKADDFGMALAQSERPISGFADVLRRRPSKGPATSADRSVAPAVQAVGLGIVHAMPPFLKGLSIIGTLAMLWVGGGIILHGLAAFGMAGPEHAVEAASKAVGGGFFGWLLGATLSGLVGLALGWLVVLGWHHVGEPLVRGAKKA
jgi:uncharacterized protein